MACVCRRLGSVTGTTTAVTTQTRPAARTTRAAKTTSPAGMAIVYQAATYVTGNGIARTAQMKTRGYVAEPPPPHAPGVLLIVAMGLALPGVLSVMDARIV